MTAMAYNIRKGRENFAGQQVLNEGECERYPEWLKEIVSAIEIAGLEVDREKQYKQLIIEKRVEVTELQETIEWKPAYDRAQLERMDYISELEQQVAQYQHAPGAAIHEEIAITKAECERTPQEERLYRAWKGDAYNTYRALSEAKGDLRDLEKKKRYEDIDLGKLRNKVETSVSIALWRIFEAGTTTDAMLGPMQQFRSGMARLAEVMRGDEDAQTRRYISTLAKMPEARNIRELRALVDQIAQIRERVHLNPGIRIPETEFLATLEAKISSTATELVVVRLSIEVSIGAGNANWDTITDMIRKHIDRQADRTAEPTARQQTDFGIMMQQTYENNRARSRSRDRREREWDTPTEKDKDRPSRPRRECWEFMDKGTCRFGDKCRFPHAKGNQGKPATGRGRADEPDRRGTLDQGRGQSAERGRGRSPERGRGTPARSTSRGGTPYPSPARSPARSP